MPNYQDTRETAFLFHRLSVTIQRFNDDDDYDANDDDDNYSIIIRLYQILGLLAYTMQRQHATNLKPLHCFCSDNASPKVG